MQQFLFFLFLFILYPSKSRVSPDYSNIIFFRAQTGNVHRRYNLEINFSVNFLSFEKKLLSYFDISSLLASSPKLHNSKTGLKNRSVRCLSQEKQPLLMRATIQRRKNVSPESKYSLLCYSTCHTPAAPIKRANTPLPHLEIFQIGDKGWKKKKKLLGCRCSKWDITCSTRTQVKFNGLKTFKYIILVDSHFRGYI